MQHCEKILASPFSARREPWCSRGCKVTLPSAHEETELHSKIASLLVPLPREAEISRLFVEKKKKIKGKKLVNSCSPVQPEQPCGCPLYDQAGRGHMCCVCAAQGSAAAGQLHMYSL